MTVKNTRRWLSLLFACVLIFQLLPPAALAEEPEITVTIATGSLGRPLADIPVEWDTAWFVSDAAEYRQELALTALALSGAAYVEMRDSLSVQDALKALGFGTVQSYHYEAAKDIGDRTAYTFGLQKLESRKGKAQYLAAVVVRGTGEYMEWASNLNVGTGSDHTGFLRAEKELRANLKRYLSQAGITGPADGSVKFLITGHSRGGAVANLLAARLCETKLARQGNIYAYTFAAPAVSTQACQEGYEWIFNIINPEDLVTQVPLEAWGYHRYGVDLPLPVEDSGELFDAVNRQYKALTGRDYAVYQDPGAPGEITAALGRLTPAPSGSGMAMLSALLSGDLEGLSALAEQNGIAALLLGKAAVEAASEITPLIRQEQAGMRSAHCAAGYYSWLSAPSGFTSQAE